MLFLGVQCIDFKQPENSKINVITDLIDDPVESKNAFDAGTQIEITCINEAELEGKSLLTCLENGKLPLQTITII